MCPPRVVLGRASREFVYMRRIGSPPQSERTSLSVRSLAHFYTQLSAVCSPEAPGTQPQCTQLIATAKSLPFLNINYKSLSSLTPAVTHLSICTSALQHNSLHKKSDKRPIEVFSFLCTHTSYMIRCFRE